MGQLNISQPRNTVFSSGDVHCSIKWKPNFSANATAAMHTAQKMFDNECARLMDKYVPMDTGTLKSSVILASDFGSGEIVYSTPYAKSQYYLHPQGTTYDGVRGPYWGQRMIADNKDHLEQFAKKAVRGAWK